MRLITAKGEIELPKDFEIRIKRTNPLLSEEGDASYPLTIPPTPNNLAVLGHVERIDRAERYVNKVEAILYAGPIQKSGHLVIDTAHRKNGIDAVFAIDSSDMYVKAKEKTLRQIFEEYDNGNGYKEEFRSVDDAYDVMQQVYQGQIRKDYVIFPVAVSAYKDGNDETVYQYNNEDVEGSLVYEERIVREGDVNMAVPKGYGLAPFLRLGSLLNRLFQVLGYTVGVNCFESNLGDVITIVHNCSDCLVTPVLRYADLVPSCTLSEFLNWLIAKFHAQPVIDSATKTADIYFMEERLASMSYKPEQTQDISALVVDDWEVQMNPTSRIVLIPTNELEGSEPAAETLHDLVDKYGYYVEANEQQFQTLSGQNPAFQDCLVLRKATGEFFLLERNMSNGVQEINRLGTNHFKYDRRNSDETEEYSQSDVMPVMTCNEERGVAPYIGTRTHRHTSYNGQAQDEEQKIIAVLAHTSPAYRYYTTGTTQETIPYRKSNVSYDFLYGLTNEWLRQQFWNQYNLLLLNNPVHLKGRVRYDTGRFLALNMSQGVVCGGRLLMPVTAEMNLSGKNEPAEAEFILGFTGGKPAGFNVFDDFINASENTLRWQILSETDWTTAERIFRNKFAGWNESPPLMQLVGVTVDHDGHGKTIWLGNPQNEGETRNITIPITITLKVCINTVQNGVITSYFIRYYKPDGEYNENGVQTSQHNYDWLHPNKTYQFEAVAI